MLDPSQKNAPWTEEEETIIHDAHLRLGNRWADITKLLTGRTDSAVKNYWYTTAHKNIGRQNKEIRGGGGDGGSNPSRSGDAGARGSSTINPIGPGGESVATNGGGPGFYDDPKPDVVPREAGIAGGCSAPVGHVEGGECQLQPVVAGLGVYGGIGPLPAMAVATAAAVATHGQGMPPVGAATAAPGVESSSPPALVPASASTLGTTAPAAVDGNNRWQVGVCQGWELSIRAGVFVSRTSRCLPSCCAVAVSSFYGGVTGWCKSE